MSGLLRGGDHVRGVEERLGRDAPTVHAHTTKTGIPFDEQHLLAQVGGVECSGVASRAGADDNDFSLDRFHVG